MIRFLGMCLTVFFFATSARSGGAGADGIVIVEEFY